MPNVFVDVVKELEDRLTTAQGDGLNLSSIKSVKVGPRSEVNAQVNMPLVRISLEDIAEETQTNIKESATMVIVVDVFDKKYDENSDNILFDSDNSSGFLYLVESVMDTIYEDTSENLDRCLGGTKILGMSVSNFRYTKGIIMATISIRVQTSYYTANGRQS